MIKKSLRAKTGLPHDFSKEVLHYPSLYGLKLFEQVQFEKKLALLILFFNGCDTLRHLFNHRFLNLQVLKWFSLNSLQFSIRLHTSLVNNFLAEVVKILLDNKLSLANNLPSVFHEPGNFPISVILGQFLYYKSVSSLKWFGATFGNRLVNKKENVFICNSVSLGVGITVVLGKNMLNVLDSDKFSDVFYTDESLKSAGSNEVISETAAYFLAVDADIGIRVAGLMSSTLTELQTVALALKCVSSSCSMVLYLDNQFVIDVCMSETFSTIVNLLKDKDISIKYVKIKEHSSVLGNIRADRYLVAEKTTVFGNACHFTGSGYDIIPDVMIKKIEWKTTTEVWHSDSYMLSGFTDRKLANLHTYLIKAVYRQLPMAIRKRLYNKSYPGVLCLLCDKIKLSDHSFTYSDNSGLCRNILVEAANMDLYTAICKDFVLRN
ncbi:hypothetical protein G9A89_005836 [Geosiphon pyriformis]|nr:hypothetical protein G9A89_005836 [Geosiphon pyriformis]